MADHTREKYDEKWDKITDDKGNIYWRDVENHQTYQHDGSLTGTWLNDCLGEKSDKFDSWRDDDKSRD